MPRLLILFPVLLFSVASPAIAQPATTAGGARPNSVAVMDTVAQGDVQAYAALATQTISSYAANNLGLEVISKDDVRNRISVEQQRQLLGCDAEACQQAANIGEVLNVERIITSTLGRIGERYQLSLVVMDVASSRVTGRATREVRSEDELVENVRDLVHFAVRGEVRESKGYARILVNAVGAKIVVDGQEYVSPLPTPLRLLAGPHMIYVSKEGFIPFEGAIDVTAGQERLLEVKLIAKKEIRVAGAGFLPWAGATLGASLLAGAASGYFYWDANNIYQTRYKADAITKAELDQAQADIEFRGNVLHRYTAWGAGVLGGVSVALFSAYFLSGLGAGGDAPGADAPMFEPTADGFAVRF